MRQGIQAELEDAELREYGCYFLCLLALGEKTRGAEYTGTEIIQEKNFARVQGWLGPECYVNDPGAVLRRAGRLAYRPEVTKEPEPPAGGDYIVCNKKTMYTHFTAVIGGEPWDPLPPLRRAAKGYRPASYRVIHGGTA